MMKKHIVCFGDSNTHGYCADPGDSVTHSDRFDESERWTKLPEKRLGGDEKQLCTASAHGGGDLSGLLVRAHGVQLDHGTDL